MNLRKLLPVLRQRDGDAEVHVCLGDFGVSIAIGSASPAADGVVYLHGVCLEVDDAITVNELIGVLSRLDKNAEIELFLSDYEVGLPIGDVSLTDEGAVYLCGPAGKVASAK